MSLSGLLSTILLVLAAGLGFFYWWGHYHVPGVDTTVPPITGQYDITAADSGKTFEFSQTSRFTVYLDSTKYDMSALACDKDGILGSISNAPVVAPPLAAARFEIVGGGTCTLKTGDFSVRIIGQSDL